MALGLLDRLADHVHVLRDPPVVVLAELLQADDAAGRHGHRAAAAVVGELARLLADGRIVVPLAALAAIVLADALDRQLDHLRRHFQAAVDRAAQGLGLHHRQAQVVAVPLAAGMIVPAAILALRAGDELQRPIQHRADARIARHAVGLAEHERARPWLYMSRWPLEMFSRPEGLAFLRT